MFKFFSFSHCSCNIQHTFSQRRLQISLHQFEHIEHHGMYFQDIKALNLIYDKVFITMKVSAVRK